MTLRELTTLAEDEMRKAQAGLPDEVRERLGKVPVFFESRPRSEDLLPSDTLGVFEEDAPIPRIRIWLANLWEYAEGDEREYREEVRITLLHEFGHALGWDEEEVRQRGLE